MAKNKKGGVKLTTSTNRRINEADIGVTEFTRTVSDNYDLVDQVDSSINVTVVNNPNEDISNRYNLYDNMSKDSVISAALEIRHAAILSPTMPCQTSASVFPKAC